MNIDTCPKDWLCPITLDLMTDPVIAPDGHTYERYAIEDWLKINKTSPVTNLPLTSNNLIPNIALRSTIEEMTKKNVKVKHEEPIIDDVDDIITIDYGTSKSDNGNSILHVRVVPPEDGKRKPTVFIFVTDVSGSMGTSVVLSESETENNGFSRLDLVKHSMKTIIQMLQPQDYISIVPFSSSAILQLPLTQMNEFGKKMATSKIEQLNPDGGTNIWDGLRLAIEIAKNDLCKNKNVAIVLLTDGEPNVNPPRGIMPTLVDYIKDLDTIFTLNTFGFGYNLDSQLLFDIAKVSNGAYSYIPDCSMVGTVFVNFVSNILATVSKKAILKIIDKTTMKEIIHDFGLIQYGQSKDISFNINSNNSSKYIIKLDYITKSNHNISIDDISEKSFDIKLYEFARDKIINSLQIALKSAINNNFDMALKNIYELYDIFSAIYASDSSEIIKSFILEIKGDTANDGQIEKALCKNSWFTKWGVHYLMSLLNAHILEQCSNFKDKSVQHYGGKLFKELRSIADDLFCKLPPPIASIKTSNYVPAASMSQYYNANGGCFSGDSIIVCSNGIRKTIDTLKKGDIVLDKLGNKQKVVCIIKMKINKKIDMVQINGMKITPWHPIYIDNKWVFPVNKFFSKKHYCEYIYNIVLDHHHIISVNGIDCITLGHGYKEGVLYHPYFGTDRIINELKNMIGWDEGLICIENCIFIRDENYMINHIEII